MSQIRFFNHCILVARILKDGIHNVQCWNTRILMPKNCNKDGNLRVLQYTMHQ